MSPHVMSHLEILCDFCAMDSKTTVSWDVENIRKEFPILNRQINGSPLVYFDNAASSQRPQRVIDRSANYYSQEHANVHRGVHTLSQEATVAFEKARETTAEFLGAKSPLEIVFTSGTTESINLVAHTFGRAFVEEGDEILISYLEHHSNIVPWQMLAEEKGAILKVIPINQQGEIVQDAFDELLSERTKLLSVSHVSNTLGSVNPVKEMIRKAHEVGATVMIDGAQAVPHMAIDVQELDADFYAFSAHKMCGPTGMGVLYGKQELLEKMPPWKGGGEMIKSVSFEKTTFNDLPHKFEAGTPDIEGVLALEEAMLYLMELGMDAIGAYEAELLDYATARMKEIPEVRFVGEAENKASVISFLLGNAHPLDVGTLMDKMGVALRTGHHCTEPIMDFFEIPGTVRASFAFYNTKEEIDIFIKALKRTANMLF